MQSSKDAALLADLEVRSESYWGYCSEFMEKFKRIYLITEEFIADHPTFMLKDNEIIIGFTDYFKVTVKTPWNICL